MSCGMTKHANLPTELGQMRYSHVGVTQANYLEEENHG